jgi:TRAP-type transport system small permease protein
VDEDGGKGPDRRAADPGEGRSAARESDELHAERADDALDDVVVAVEVADVRGAGRPVTAGELPLVFRVLDHLISALLVVGFVVLLGVIGVNVFGRMVGRGIPWADEASRFLFIWVAFLGAAVAYFRREHISVSFLIDKLPRWPRLIAMILQELLVLAVLGFLMVGAFALIDATFRRSALLGVPLSYIFASVPVAAFLMAMMAIYRVGRLLSGREE